MGTCAGVLRIAGSFPYAGVAMGGINGDPENASDTRRG